MTNFLGDDATFHALGAGDIAAAAWATYVPTVTAASGTITSYTVNSAVFSQIGKMIFVEVDITITNNGTGAANVLITAPVTARSLSYVLVGREIGSTGKTLNVYIGPLGSTSSFSLSFYDATYPGGTGSNRLCLSGVYEAA